MAELTSHPKMIQLQKGFHLDAGSKMAGPCWRASMFPYTCILHLSHSARRSRRLMYMDEDSGAPFCSAFLLGLAKGSPAEDWKEEREAELLSPLVFSPQGHSGLATHLCQGSQLYQAALCIYFCHYMVCPFLSTLAYCIISQVSLFFAKLFSSLIKLSLNLSV